MALKKIAQLWRAPDRRTSRLRVTPMLARKKKMIRDYYNNHFSAHLAAFMPDGRVPYFGHSWAYDCGNLDKIPIESRPAFLLCLYVTVLVDQAMYTHFRSAYDRFAELTQYPKFCHGLGQFQKNPRELLFVPIQKGMVNKDKMEKELAASMELFINEVVDFFQHYMTHINPADFFDKLLYDADVQIPLLIVMINPEMKDDIVVRAYEALRAAVEKKIRKGANKKNMTKIEEIKGLIDEIKQPYEIMVLDRYLKEAMSKLGVAQNRGSLVGEYAEYLAATAFHGSRMSNATEGHDLTLSSGDRIEVKGRIFEGSRVPMNYINDSTIAAMTFDYLIYIVFDEDMSVKYAMKISHSSFKKIARYVKPRKAPPKWVFVAKPALLDSPHVINITNEIKMAENKING